MFPGRYMTLFAHRPPPTGQAEQPDLSEGLNAQALSLQELLSRSRPPTTACVDQGHLALRWRVCGQDGPVINDHPLPSASQLADDEVVQNRLGGRNRNIFKG